MGPFKNSGLLKITEGTVLLKQGTASEKAYIIQSGSFRLEKNGQNIGQAVAGDILNPSSLRSNEDISFSAICEQDANVFAFARSDYDGWIEGQDQFTRTLIRTLLRRDRVWDEPHNDLASVISKSAQFTKSDFSMVRSVLGEQNRQIRQSLKGGLHHKGFRDILDVGSFRDLSSSIMSNEFDILIFDAELNIEDSCEMVRAIRHREIGNNPFVNILAMLAKPDQNNIKRLVDVGVDDLLIKPISAGDLIDRVERQLSQRKPFVVTFDYVGPDRRKVIRPGQEVIKSFEVPNPMAAQALAKCSSAELRSHVDRCWESVVEMKIERYAIQLKYQISQLDTKQAKPEDCLPHLDQIANVAELSESQMIRTRFKDHCTLVRSIAQNAKDDSTRQGNFRDLITLVSDFNSTIFAKAA